MGAVIDSAAGFATWVLTPNGVRISGGDKDYGILNLDDLENRIQQLQDDSISSNIEINLNDRIKEILQQIPEEVDETHQTIHELKQSIQKQIYNGKISNKIGETIINQILDYTIGINGINIFLIELNKKLPNDNENACEGVLIDIIDQYKLKDPQEILKQFKQIKYQSRKTDEYKYPDIDLQYRILHVIFQYARSTIEKIEQVENQDTFSKLFQLINDLIVDLDSWIQEFNYSPQNEKEKYSCISDIEEECIKVEKLINSINRNSFIYNMEGYITSSYFIEMKTVDNIDKEMYEHFQKNMISFNVLALYNKGKLTKQNIYDLENYSSKNPTLVEIQKEITKLRSRAYLTPEETQEIGKLYSRKDLTPEELEKEIGKLYSRKDLTPEELEKEIAKLYSTKEPTPKELEKVIGKLYSRKDLDPEELQEVAKLYSTKNLTLVELQKVIGKLYTRNDPTVVELEKEVAELYSEKVLQRKIAELNSRKNLTPEQLEREVAKLHSMKYLTLEDLTPEVLQKKVAKLYSAKVLQKKAEALASIKDLTSEELEREIVKLYSDKILIDPKTRKLLNQIQIKRDIIVALRKGFIKESDIEILMQSQYEPFMSFTLPTNEGSIKYELNSRGDLVKYSKLNNEGELEKYSTIQMFYDSLSGRYQPNARIEFDKNNQKIKKYPLDEKCFIPNPFNSFEYQFSIYNTIKLCEISLQQLKQYITEYKLVSKENQEKQEKNIKNLIKLVDRVKIKDLESTINTNGITKEDVDKEKEQPAEQIKEQKTKYSFTSKPKYKLVSKID